MRALERANVQVARLNTKLLEETRKREAAETELARWKKRCYPKRGDIVAAGIEPEHAAAWLDQHTVRVDGGWALDVGADEGDRFDVWREGEDYPTEIALAIEWAADGLGLDQWVVLEEMAAIANGDATHASIADAVTAKLTGEVAGG